MELKQACNQFLHHCKSIKNLSPHTCRAYSTDLEEFFTLVKSGQKSQPKVSEISRHDLKSYIQHLFDDRSLKESSVKRKLACLKVFFRWLEIEDQIETSPFHKLDTKITLPKRLPRNISSSDLKRLLYQCKPQTKVQEKTRISKLNQSDLRPTLWELTTRLSVELMFATGIRVSELVSITLEAINISDNSIRIQGKGKRERKVFILDEDTILLLRTYVELRLQFMPNTKTLLINSRGNAASTQFIRKLVRKAGEAAGLSSRITPHRFRHTCATQLIEAGVDIRFVQKLLGHSSISTTEIYTQVCDSALKATIAKADTKNRLFRVSTDN